MRFKSFLTVICLCNLFSGCIMVNLPDVKHVPTASYGLKFSGQHVTAGFPIAVGFFSSDVPVKFKMLVRNGAELSPIPFAKWTEPPAYLVSSAFRQIFNAESDDFLSELPVLEGKILTFEETSGENLVIFQAEYRLLASKKQVQSRVLFSKILTTEVKAKDNSAAAYAEAMSEAVEKQAAILAKELAQITVKK